MAIETTVNRWDFVGNGIWTQAHFTGLVFNAADLVVKQTTPGGVVTTLVLNSQYTVTNNYPLPGGDIVFSSPFPDQYKLAVIRRLDLKQSTGFRNQGAFFAELHEDAFDRLTMIAQQHDEQIGRAPSLKESSTYKNLTVDDPIASQYLRWKSDLSGIESVGISVGSLSAALSAGRIPYADGAASLNSTSALLWDNTNKKLSIIQTVSAQDALFVDHSGGGNGNGMHVTERASSQFGLLIDTDIAAIAPTLIKLDHKGTSAAVLAELLMTGNAAHVALKIRNPGGNASADAIQALNAAAAVVFSVNAQTGAIIGGTIALGTNPASAGTVRIPNSGSLIKRNAANNADISIIADLGSDATQIGATTALTVLQGSEIRWGKALVALGGGAAPTFGTIGGSGPATAGQNSWMRVQDSTGAAFWVPAWK